MPEKVMPGPVCDAAGIREAVCVHTRKIMDACRDKDCIEDLRVYLTQSSQCALDRASCVKAAKAELLYVSTNVEPICFNRGFYTVDVRYFYRITADAFVGAARPVEVCGLAVFDKRVILFGSEGCSKSFSSEMSLDALDCQNLPSVNQPVAVVEAVIYGQRFKTQENPSIIVRERRPTIGPRSCIPTPRRASERQQFVRIAIAYQTTDPALCSPDGLHPAAPPWRATQSQGQLLSPFQNRKQGGQSFP